MRRLLACLLALSLASAAGSALAAKRIALVVGNDAYEEVVSLKKAVNDARAVAAALKPLGFEVETVENATRSAFSRSLVDLLRKIQPGDVVLFFFAGHGFEINGTNYLLPVDVPEAREGEAGLVEDAGFAAKDVIDRIQAKGAGTIIAVLDACRNNPFARPGTTRALGGTTRGLARMDATDGVFILFSAGNKQEALDGLGEDDKAANSVFTRTFVRELAVPGLSLVDIAKDTQSKVKALAASVGHEQTPAYYDQVVGNFFLKPLPPGAKRAAPSDDSALAAEVAAWKAITNSTDLADFQGYLNQYGDTALFADEARRRMASLVPPGSQPAVVTNADKSDLIAACIAATAQPGDPANLPGVAGVPWDKIDASAAEAACRKARAVTKTNPQVALGLAVALQKGGQPGEAAPLYEEAANHGEAAAANNAGALYYAGDGVPVDYARARLYYERADKGGYYGSVLRYADMLERGLGGPSDPALAMGVLRSAAQAGVAEAAFTLGIRYDQGVGVGRDAKTARQWYELAVKNGYPFAAFTLAVLVGHGEGGPIDRTRAAQLVVQAFAGDSDPKTSDDMRQALKRFDKRVLLELERLLSRSGENPGRVDGSLDNQSYAALDALAAKWRQGAN